MGGQAVSAKDVSGTLYENVAETTCTTLSLSKDPQARGISSFGAEAANRLKKNGVQVNPGAEDGCESVPSSQTKAERPIARLAAAAGTLRWSFSKSKAVKHHAPEVIGSEPDVVDSVPSVEVPSVEAATPISGSMASIGDSASLDNYPQCKAATPETESNTDVSSLFASGYELSPDGPSLAWQGEELTPPEQAKTGEFQSETTTVDDIFSDESTFLVNEKIENSIVFTIDAPTPRQVTTSSEATEDTHSVSYGDSEDVPVEAAPSPCFVPKAQTSADDYEVFATGSLDKPTENGHGVDSAFSRHDAPASNTRDEMLHVQKTTSVFDSGIGLASTTLALSLEDSLVSTKAKEEMARLQVEKQLEADEVDTRGGLPSRDDSAAVCKTISDDEAQDSMATSHEMESAERCHQINDEEFPRKDSWSQETGEHDRNRFMEDAGVENRTMGDQQPISCGAPDHDDKTHFDFFGSPESDKSGAKPTVNSPSTIASDDEVFHDSWDQLNHEGTGTEENFSLAILEASHDTPANNSASNVLSQESHGKLSSSLIHYSHNEANVFHDVGDLSFDDSSVAIMADRMQRRKEDSQFTDSWMHGDTIQNFMGWADQAIRASDTESVKNFEISVDLNGLNDFDDESTIATMQDDMSVMSGSSPTQSSNYRFATSGAFDDINPPFEEWKQSHNLDVNTSVAASILFSDAPANSIPDGDLNLLNMGLSFPTNVPDGDAGLAFGMGDAGFDDGLGFGGNSFGYGNGDNMNDFSLGTVNRAEARKKSPEQKGWFRGWIG